MIEWEPHRYMTRTAGEVAATWGTLALPERRGAEGGKKVSIACVRLESTAREPSWPVLFLAGGPGESGVEAGRGQLYRLFAALRAVGDVLLVDQRACGASRPALDCGGTWELPLEQPAERGTALREARARSQECARRLRDLGIDLDAYNTSESADDIADLCRALGHERVHLLGASYGTHLAMEVMRRHPFLVASAVLAGPEGPDHTWKLPSNVEHQLERIALRSGQSDFKQTVRGVLDRLDDAPIPARLSDARGRPTAVPVGRFDVEYIAATGAADTRLVRLMPAWFARLARGDGRDFERHPLLGRYLMHLRRGLGRSALGFCMDCASGATEARWRRIEKEARECVLGRTIDFPFPEIAAAWGVADLGDTFRAPPRSDAPVLFVTGTWDCRTPDANARELAAGLPRSRHLVVEDAGHTDLLFGEEVTRRVVSFFKGCEVDTSPIPPTQPFRFEEP